MKRFSLINRGAKVALAGIMAAATIMAGTAVSSAAEAGELDNESKFVRSSFSLGNEDGLEEEIITDVDKKWNITNMTDSSSNNARVSGHEYKWTLEPEDIYIVDEIYRTAGSKIRVSCGISKGNNTDYVVVGIIEPDGTARAVKGQAAVAHSFEIKKDGYYSVFARNINSTDITVSFIYYLK